MDYFANYLIQNWAMILVLLAFAIMLRVTVFLNKRTVMRMYILMVAVFLLSIIVFAEFELSGHGEYRQLRNVMTAIRYSATPFIVAYILFTLVKKAHWYIFIPAIALAVINIISIFTGIVFSVDDSGYLVRGVLGYLPYIGVGVYSFFLVFVLVWQSNKQITEIIPICFMAFSFASGIVLPFFVGKEYSRIFCTTIAIALFVYFVFSILQLTKKDALTGLLNRQAYYATLREGYKDITAIVSIDMNGLKKINDTYGHAAGDEAIMTLANCFSKCANPSQLVYRIGGDEFIFICRKTNEEQLKSLIQRIRETVSETKYSCSIGYCYAPNNAMSYDDMIKESDNMMYADKAEHYSKEGHNRRAGDK